MKMAKASEADLAMGNEVSKFLESLEKGYMPDFMGDEETFFDDGDAEQCQRVLQKLVELSKQASLFRVTFGMLVVCDPANEILDPDADTLEVHPKFERLKVERDLLLAACSDLIAYCDKNPPMGDSLWSVQEIRAAVSRCLIGGSK